MTKRQRKAWINIPPIPHIKTITVLALGFLFGNLLFLPMIALIGKFVPDVYQDTVNTVATLFKDGMLLILGYYFRDRQDKKDPDDE